MSEFLAEASVLIQANTVAFRAELAKTLAAVPKSIEIPIVAVGGTGAASAAATRREVAAATRESAAAAGVAAGAIDKEAASRTKAGVALQRETTAATAAERAGGKLARNAKEIRKGLVAQAASAAGLRGAIIGANSAFILATAGAIAFGKSLQSAAQFQTELATFAATTGATADQMREVSDAAKQLGADITLPAVNAQDAAVAMTELAKAGLSVRQSIDGARGVLQLATAAGIDNAAATELAASALNSFGLSGGDAVHVADVLANASNDAQGSITDMGIALQQASAAGRQAGLSLEETAGILTVFARNGIKGSDAGTLLRTMLIRLINPTDKAQKVMDDLGLHIRDATGGINLGFFDEFARKTKNLTAAERDRDAAIIAGQDAFRGLSILSREGGAVLDAQVGSLNKAGTAAELAAARTAGFAGAMENLKNQLSTAGLALGTALAPGLTDLANNLASAISRTQDLVEGIGDLADAAAKPIDVVVNVIRKVAERGGIPGLGDALAGSEADKAKLTVQQRFKNLFSKETLKGSGLDLVGNLRGILKEGDAVLAEHHLVLGPIGFPTLTQARAEIKDLFDELNKTPTPTKFNETVLKLIEIQKQMAGGTLGSKEFAKSLTPVIQRLQNLSSTNVKIPDIKFPSSLEQGARPAGEKASRAFGQTFGPSIVQVVKRAGDDSWTALAGTVDPGVASFTAAVSKALASSRLRAGALASQQIKLEFQGASQSELRANLEKTLAAQKATVDALLKKPGARQAAIDTARQNAIQTQDQIDAIDDAAKSATEQAIAKRKQAAADREAKARKAADAIAKSDQAAIDSLAGSQQRINLAQIDASATARLSDDIAVQRLIANTASREIAIIDKTVKDAKARNAAIAARVAILKAAGVELDRLRKEQADAAAGKAQAAREAVTANLEKKLQLAQIIGKKDPILAAFDALIANERKNLAAAKKADRLDALIKLQQTIKDRNDFLENIKKDASEGVKQATTAFDLLTQFSQVFNQNAGNLIGGNQPFAGPTGFTADIAQFLIRRQPPPGTTPQFPGKAADNTLVQANTRLTDAIIKLTDTIGKSGRGTATRSGVSSVTQSRVWHSENMIARQFQEG